MKYAVFACLISFILSVSAHSHKEHRAIERRRSLRSRCNLLDKLTCWVSLCDVSYCAAYPEAECRLKVLACGCRAAWYTRWGEVDCDVKAVRVGSNIYLSRQLPRTYQQYTQDQFRYRTGRRVSRRQLYRPSVAAPIPTGECPNGVVRVRCTENPCSKVEIPGAECRPNFCGGCEANFYRNGIKVPCDRCSFPRDMIVSSVPVIDTRAYVNNNKARVNSGTYPVVPDIYTPGTTRNYTPGAQVPTNTGLNPVLGPFGNFPPSNPTTQVETYPSVIAMNVDSPISNPNTFAKDTVLPGGTDYMPTPDQTLTSGTYVPEAGIQVAGRYPTDEMTGTYPDVGAVSGTGTYPDIGAVSGTQTYPDVGAISGTQTYPDVGAVSGTQTYPDVGNVGGTAAYPDVGTVTGSGSYPEVGTVPDSTYVDMVQSVARFPKATSGPSGTEGTYVDMVQSVARFPKATLGPSGTEGTYVADAAPPMDTGSYPSGSPDIIPSIDVAGNYAPDVGGQSQGIYPAGTVDTLLSPDLTSGTYVPDAGLSGTDSYPAGTGDILPNPDLTSGTYVPDSSLSGTGILPNTDIGTSSTYDAGLTGTDLMGTPDTYAPVSGMTCPPGQEPTLCAFDPCLNRRCDKYPKAECRHSVCGNCQARFFFNNTEVDCEVCPSNTIVTSCPANPCDIYSCPAYPDAVCRWTKCSSCKESWYLPEGEVACDVPATHTQCTMQEQAECNEVCSPVHCHSDLQAICRIRGCGAGCKKEYYKRVNGQITVVQCQLWGVWYDRSKV